MNSDFRVAVDFADHPKVEKLVRRLGDVAFRCLVRLQGWTAKNRPDGILLNLDVDDVEIAAGWTGETGQFCQTLLELRIIDRSDEHQCFELHNWREYNQWAAEATGRSEHARRVNHQRWHVDRGRVEPECALCKPSDGQTKIRTESDGESHTESSFLLSSSPFGTTPKEKETSDWRKSIGRILSIFPTDRPTKETVTASLAGDWLKAHGGDIEHLVQLIEPHVRRPIGYVTAVVNDPENQKTAKQKKNGRRSKGFDKEEPSGAISKHFGNR